jgi:hypothetical protein
LTPEVEVETEPTVPEREMVHRRRDAIARERKRKTAEEDRLLFAERVNSGEELQTEALTGAALELSTVRGTLRYTLKGEVVVVGDAIEVYTNGFNGWIRGRFEWDGVPETRPKIAVNVWNPKGPADEDGLPPWVGDLEAELPAAALCRWG